MTVRKFLAPTGLKLFFTPVFIVLGTSFVQVIATCEPIKPLYPGGNCYYHYLLPIQFLLQRSPATSSGFNDVYANDIGISYPILLMGVIFWYVFACMLTVLIQKLKRGNQGKKQDWPHLVRYLLLCIFLYGIAFGVSYMSVKMYDNYQSSQGIQGYNFPVK